MAYYFLKLNKIRSFGELTARYNYNFRKMEVGNIGHALMDRDEELVLLRDLSGFPCNYVSAFKERTEGIKIRNSAIYSIEALTTFSRNAGINLDDWKKENVSWFRETFDHAGDGVPNLISVIYHGYESGNGSCHAMVIPIDDKMHLSANFYIGGTGKSNELQNSYAEKMAHLGLERDAKRALSRRDDIRKFYAEMNAAKICLNHMGEPENLCGIERGQIRRP